MNCRTLLTWFGLLSLACSLAAAQVPGPLQPDAAQRQFVLADASLRIELAAAEPAVIDPVAIRFDEDGRLWVAEMRDYPLGPPAGGQPLSQIRVLTDRDGDGRFESAQTFAERLSFVTGLQPWKGGAFVTLAGRVAYLKDTDGDGRADLDETWFEGFAEQNSQLRANHPRLALDNHIYVANGLRGGKVVNRKLPDQPPIDISGMDFRFDPHTGQAEAVSGNGQFGLCLDDWGNRFTCSNRNPCRHAVIEDRYLRASPGVTVPAVMHDVAAFAEQSRIFPISRAWTTSNLHAGQFTAACGVFIYRGDLLPAEFKGNVFTCDPTGNLIHREIVQPAGPTFTSRPADEGKEFLASPDEWFRPVNMELGPDGALYVVDMYRCVIEHPEFVPDELKQRPDQRLGDDRGRIWRIVPAPLSLPLGAGGGEGEQRQAAPKLSSATSEELVKLLEHPSAWHRETAQRLLVERGGQAATKALRQQIAAAASPLARTHARWTLAGLAALAPADALSALDEADPQALRQAVVLAERFADRDDLQARLATVARHQNPAVRFQALLASPARLPLHPRVADAEDPWMRMALRLALDPQSAAAALQGWLGEAHGPGAVPPPGHLLLTGDLFEIAVADEAPPAARQAIELARMLLIDARGPAVGIAALQGALRGLTRRQVAPAAVASAAQWAATTGHVARLAADEATAQQQRLAAIGLLGVMPETAALLVPLCGSGQDQAVRLAAIAALARQPGTDHWLPLLGGFPSDTPAARRAIVEGLLASADRTRLLLDAIEAGSIKPGELDLTHAQRLTTSGDARIKERAGQLFAAATPAERIKALADYQPVLTLAADARRGQAIFEKNCAACHQIGGIGVNVAPDISDSRTKTAAQLLADVLQPNRAIDNNYLGYSVRLVDGTVASGILTTETATSVTLRQQGGKDLVVGRGEIEELRSSGQSLMPEGLERQIPPQEMADLLSFIKNWRYLDGLTPAATVSAEANKP